MKNAFHITPLPKRFFILRGGLSFPPPLPVFSLPLALSLSLSLSLSSSFVSLPSLSSFSLSLSLPLALFFLLPPFSLAPSPLLPPLLFRPPHTPRDFILQGSVCPVLLPLARPCPRCPVPPAPCLPAVSPPRPCPSRPGPVPPPLSCPVPSSPAFGKLAAPGQETRCGKRTGPSQGPGPGKEKGGS